MSLSKEQLGNIIKGKAAALCRPEYDGTRAVSRPAVNEGMGGGPDPSMYDGDAARWDAMFSDYANEDYTPSRDIQYNEAGAARSQMPAAIKESMMKNKIDVDALGNTSVLSSLGIKGKPTTAPTQRRQQVVNEQTMPVMGAQNYGGVDYSIIKAIVSECIKEYFNSQPINENTIRTIGLGKGSIKIVDTSGNVWEGKLKKLGNVNNSN